SPLRVLIESDRISSVIFWGPPGTGKTTLAEVVALSTDRFFERLSAVSAGVKDVREAIELATERLGQLGKGTIVFIDEIHRFSTSQQDALLPSVEAGIITLIGATTENPYFELNAPLRSRSTLFRLEPLQPADVLKLLHRGVAAESVDADADALDALAQRCAGDARQALTALEVACALSHENNRHLNMGHVDAALGVSALRYGRDDHYDVVSAFIKSIRGSDPQAGLFWLARMLESGDDARFIARRLVILASEDIGLADSNALVVAIAAATALEHVGLPEAQLNLAQAVVYLANAPKSNRVALGIWSAREDIRRGVSAEVPAHLRDGHYQGAKDFGHGVGYAYPHDDPRGWVDQQYLPEEVDGSPRRKAVYYEPSTHGEESEISKRSRE
ncbi:MAG: replication-associated recombination protein A, partial [Actinomycetota bacterium]